MRTCPRCLLTYADTAQFCGLDGTRLIDTEHDLLLGSTLGRYRIEQVLGAGATARVYLAEQLDLGRKCAVKILSGEMSCHRRVATRLQREAQAAGQINHPHVVSVTDSGVTAAGVVYIVMDLVHGETLYEILAAEGAISPRRAALFLRHLADGLHGAHSLGFVHRDLKPSNLIVSSTASGERLQILDFGLVAKVPDGASEETRLTRTGGFVGTPLYIAPEMVMAVDEDERQISPASDLYAVGAILFEMLTGAPPFVGNVTDVLAQHLHSPPPPLPPCGGLEEIALWLLKKDPGQRPGSAREVLHLLDAIESRGELSGVRSIPAPRGRKRRAKAVAAGIGLSVMAVFLFAWLAIANFFHHPDWVVTEVAREDSAAQREVGAAAAVETAQKNEPEAGLTEGSPKSTDAPTAPGPADRRRKKHSDPARTAQRTSARKSEGSSSSEVVELHLDSEPHGAAVFSSAGKLGETPLDVTLRRDESTLLHVKLDGYREHTFQWTPQWKSRKIVVRLERGP